MLIEVIRSTINLAYNYHQVSELKIKRKKKEKLKKIQSLIEINRAYSNTEKEKIKI